MIDPRALADAILTLLVIGLMVYFIAPRRWR